MDVVSTGAVRVASAVWQPRPGTWALTVVCKATFHLEPGESPLADIQEDPAPDDAYWDDDPSRSLSLPSDLVPWKPAVDVLLVGHAFAPAGRPVRSLTARLVVGGVDKCVEVWCDRIFWHDGSLLEGPPFARMPLRYERAGGGPGTENPVGLRWDAPPDARGAVPVPNLQPRGTRIARRGDTFAPIGLGPIAPAWRGRVEKLGRYAADFSGRDWRELSFPADLDGAYFNAAPPDQQIAQLAPDEFILLESLHPDHPRLETCLPGVQPEARLTAGDRAGEEVALTADTLTIDTDRGLATVVWRGHVSLRHRDEGGRITVSVDDLAATSPILPPGTMLLDRGGKPLAAALPFARKADAMPTTQTVLGGKLAGPALPFAAPKSPWAAFAAEPAVTRDPPAPAPTGTLLVMKGQAREVLPFAGAAPPRPAQLGAPSVPAAPPEVEDEETPPLPEARAPEPPAYEPPAYVPPAPAPPAYEPPAYESRAPQPLGYGSLAAQPLGYAQPPLGYRPATPEAPAPEPPVPVAAAPEPAAPIAAEPVEASTPEAPPEPDPVVLPLERCAAIAASIARRPDDRAQILEDEKLSAADFAREDLRWSKALKDEAGRGQRALAQAYDAAYVGRLEEERGPIELAEYGQLVVAGERGKVAETLADLGLPRGAMMRIERVWLRKVMSDAKLGKGVGHAVKVARRG